MLEHMGLEDFAAFLCTNGFVVCGITSWGTAARLSKNTKGYFGDTDRVAHLLMMCTPFGGGRRRAFRMSRIFCSGTAWARLSRALPDALRARRGGAVFSGTAGRIRHPLDRHAAGAHALEAARGRYKSRYLEKIASEVFGRVHDGTGSPFSWISSDPREVLRYERDGKMHFIFTVSAFYTLFELMDGVGSLRWAQSLPKNMPVLLVSGQRDPVGANGKGVRAVYRLLREAGMKDVRLRMYRGRRHEMIHEVNREEVMRMLLAWLRSRMPNDEDNGN
jgi:hypothetical protein